MKKEEPPKDKPKATILGSSLANKRDEEDDYNDEPWEADESKEKKKTFGQKGFRKRMVVLEQTKGTFTNFIPVEFLKDACDAVDELAPGDQIEVTYRLTGRRWQRDAASEAKYFLSAEAISFKRLSAGGRAEDGPDDAIDINDDLAEAGADDVPF